VQYVQELIMQTTSTNPSGSKRHLPGEERRYQSYTLKNFRTIPQIQKLFEQQLKDIEIVGRVLPFKTNNYVIEHLIDWQNIPEDPMFILNFSRKDMLRPHHYQKIADLFEKNAPPDEIEKASMEIRWELNPHPAGQKFNIPSLDGTNLEGSQHKYRETVLFFPSQGQTCHAYCNFCFRWPQFVGIKNLNFQ
jgi:hypothetical protein